MFTPKRVYGIDPIFSQFYANPMYLNPAFAGSVRCTRMILNYRNQPYPAFGTFSTYSFSLDKHYESLSGGLGINIMHDSQADLLSRTQAGLAYAYHGRISQEWFVNFGVNASYINYRLHWDNLEFPDQFNYQTGTIQPSGELSPDNLNSHLADFSAGILLYNESFFAGFSASHLSQPNIDFFAEDKLPLKVSFQMGYEFFPGQSQQRHRTAEGISVTPSLIFESQAGLHRFNYGMYVNTMPVIAGVWLRQNVKHPNSLIFLLGIKQAKYRIGYSYDYSLSGYSGYGGGAHEISVLRNFNCSDRNMKYRILNCPTF